MSRFVYLRLYADSEGLWVKTPDDGVFEYILGRMRVFVPYAEGAGSYGVYRITRLDGRRRELANFIVQELCSQGWEPFCVTRASAPSEDGKHEAIHLRLEMS